MARILGIDPGLNKTGWGIIECNGSSFKFIASGIIITDSKTLLPKRFKIIFTELTEIIKRFQPSFSAIEETFVNLNSASSIKLAQARAISMLALEISDIEPKSYAAKQVKKFVAGYGQADKTQVAKMVKLLLPNAEFNSNDASDALSIAICHAFNNGRF